MQETTTIESWDIHSLVKISIPVLFLGIIAILSPFAILLRNVAPPYDPPPPGWESSSSVFIWGRSFSVAPPAVLIAGPFVGMTLIYVAIHIVVSMRKMPAKYGVVSEIILFLIWVSVCQMIYGTLEGWTLTQFPLLPIVGISFLLVVYRYQLRQ